MGTLVILPPTQLVFINPDVRSGPPDFDNGWRSATGNTDADLVAGFGNPADVIHLDYAAPLNVSEDIEIHFGWLVTDEVFVLDGGSPVAYTSLPPGFVMRGTLTLNHDVLSGLGAIAAASTGQPTARLEIMSQVNSGPMIDEGSPLWAYPNPDGDINLDITDGSYILASDFITTRIKLKISGLVSGSGPGTKGGADFGYYSFLGDYTTESSSWTVENTDPVTIGDTLTVTADPDIDPPIPGATLKDVDALIVYDDFPDDDDPLIIPIVPPAGGGPFEDPIEWTPIIITVTVTIGLVGPGTKIVRAHLTKYLNPDTGTYFTGTVPLGTLTYFLTDATGIYRLVPGKESDTLYDHDHTGETIEVKIPDPYIRTGFIGG